MANKNFEVKHGLSVGGTERITAAGAGSLTNLTLSGNLTVQGTTVTLDASTLQVADKNIVLNYHASNDTSSAANGAGITIQDAVDASNDATLTWNASLDKFDLSHGLHIGSSAATGSATTPALQIGGATTYRLGLYTTAEGGVIDNANGDDGIQFHTKTAGEAVRITSDGKVGIGTSSPSTTLDVRAGGDSLFSTTGVVSGGVTAITMKQSRGSLASPSGSSTNGDGNYIVSKIHRGGSYETAAWIGMTTDSGADDGRIIFGTAKAGSIGERVRIDEDGNVGIATASPQATLSVKQSLAAGGADLRVLDLVIPGSWSNSGNAGHTADISWTNSESAGSVMGKFGLRYAGTATGGNSEFVFKDMYQGGYGASADVMYLGSNGYVGIPGRLGIANNSPAHALDVTGTIRAYASGSGNAWLYTQNGNKTYLTGVRGSSSNAYSIYDLTADKSRFRVNSDGGIAIGENNVGYAGQILSIKAGAGDNVLYGESTDTKCILSLRDNSSTANIGYGALANAHVFFQDGTEVARISTGSADKYPTSGNGGIGGNGTNLHIHGDDSEIRMANQIIHADNSGLTKFTIRNAYGYHSTGAELSLDSGYISFNTGSSYTERMRVMDNGTVGFGLASTSGISNSSGTGNEGAFIQGDGLIVSSISNDLNLILNRKTSNGTIIQFRYNGGNVGTISTNGNSLPSDRNFKRDIEDLNIGLDLVNKLNPVSYNYKIDNDETPKMYGLIAQDLEQSLEEVGVDKNSIQLLQHKPNDDEKESDYSLDYLKLTPILIKAIQEQQTVIEDLKTRIATLEG